MFQRHLSPQHRIALSMVAGALAALATFLLWDAGAFLPSWTQWEEASLVCSMSGRDAERVTLHSRRVSVDGGLSYETPADWKVFSAAATDLDGDGTDELLIALWKRGTLGTSRAIWETGWHPGYAQHLYVLTYSEGSLVPFWMGGDLDGRVTRMYVDDRHQVHLMTAEGKDTVWTWEAWGFWRDT